MNRLGALLFLLLLSSCRYDCEKVPQHKLWKATSYNLEYATKNVPDILIFRSGTNLSINNNCQLLLSDTVIGTIISGEVRELTKDEKIVVRYTNGAEIEYVSK